jgi:flagellar basal-body rod protein FlgC
MGLFDAIDISASGLSAERLRMDVTAENLANAQTTRGPNGGPYQRREVVLQTAQPNGFATQLARATTGLPGMPGMGSGQPPGGVQAAGIVADATPPRQVYDPGHPDANAQGYVLMPNVNPVTEMVDLIASSRSYEANVTALQTAKSMFSKTFDLLR